MKRISALVAAALLAVLLQISACRSAGTRAAAVPDHITLTWTDNPASTMTVTWRTDTSVTSGVVECGAKRFTATSSDFKTDLGDIRIFTSTLTGLHANTKYSYRVGDGEHWSEMHSFTTAAAKPRAFRFLVFGDSQSSTSGDNLYGEWRTTIHNAYEANPTAKFFVNVGDLSDKGASCEHWNCWFSATTGVIDSIPAMPTLGNHEYNGEGGPSYWVSQFHTPQNGPDGLKSRVYSYDYGRAHLVVLDSEKVSGDNLQPLLKWLDADLAASNATWKMVFFHRTPYELKDGRSNDSLRAALCPTLEKNHVDLVFNGHDHGVGRTWPMQNGRNMDKPSQGTIYFVAGRSGTKKYKDLSKRAWDAFFYNPLDQPNYLVVQVNDMRINVRTMNQDGTLIDSFFIDKKNDTTSDMQGLR